MPIGRPWRITLLPSRYARRLVHQSIHPSSQAGPFSTRLLHDRTRHTDRWAGRQKHTFRYILFVVKKKGGCARNRRRETDGNVRFVHWTERGSLQLPGKSDWTPLEEQMRTCSSVSEGEHVKRLGKTHSFISHHHINTVQLLSNDNQCLSIKAAWWHLNYKTNCLSWLSEKDSLTSPPCILDTESPPLFHHFFSFSEWLGPVLCPQCPCLSATADKMKWTF